MKLASAPAGQEGPAKTCGRSGRSWAERRASACGAAALLDPGDARWGVNVGGRADLFVRIGVARGLRLKPADRLRFQDGAARLRPSADGCRPEYPATHGRRGGSPCVRRPTPEYVSPFDYRLEGVLDLPELHGSGDLSQGGRRVFSRLVVDSMQGWPSGWERATVRKVGGETQRAVDHLAPQTLAGRDGVALRTA